PIATDAGAVPVAKSSWAAKLGVAAPGAVVLSSTDTVTELLFATARSSLPSPFRSPTVTDSGLAPVPKSWWAAKLGVAAPGAVVLSSTDTVPEIQFTTARSPLPSPFRSPSVTDVGLAPVAKSCLAAKLGVAAPAAVVLSSTDIVLELKFATARSSLPSPFRSPTVTDSGLIPVPNSSLAAKLGVAAPGAVVLSSTDTVLQLKFATARSSLPSPFRSPTVTDTGPVLVAKSCLAAKLGVAAPGAVVLSSTDTLLEPTLAPARSS